MRKKVVFAAASAALLSTAYAGTASASTYKIHQGDTLSYIAVKYHTSVLDLKKLNNLNSDLIQVNQMLQLDKQIMTLASTKPAAAPAIATTPASAAVYTIVSGDTLSGIASKFHISISDLMQWNNLKGYLIYPGQKLKVSSDTVAAPKAPTAPAKPAALAAPQKDTTTYVIKSGDTLGAIAKQFCLTVDSLKQLSNLKSDIIFPGQKLEVTAKAVTKPAPVETPKQTQTQTQTQPQAPASTGKYVVKSGETLSLIALQFDTTVKQIKDLNNLSSTMIYVGQTLKVPDADVVQTSPAPTASDLAANVIQEAKKVMGVPYVWGGSTLDGFDCSGFIYYVYNKAGFSTSRYNAEGFYSRSHYVDQPQPGDLVFFENTYKQGISHVGIYLGNNQFIHADENRGIAITSLDSSYFKAHIDGFKRFY